MSEERTAATLTLIDGLKASIELEEHSENGKVADLAAERAKRQPAAADPYENLCPYEITPADLLRKVLADVESGTVENVTKCYITLISDDGKRWGTTSYRSCLHVHEEVAFRQLGAEEAMRTWQCGGMNE